MKILTLKKKIILGSALIAGLAIYQFYVKFIPQGDTPKETLEFIKSKTHDQLFPAKGNPGWVKHKNNPLLFDRGNIYFDVSALTLSDSIIALFYSWRNCKGIGFSRSQNGLDFNDRHLILNGIPDSKWEQEVNRPDVHKIGNRYVMWYTGQTTTNSSIGIAYSEDLYNWTRNDTPVLIPTEAWEKTSVMCPSIVYDSTTGKYQMWYSGGDQYEPDAIGYAESNDGIQWNKSQLPVFVPNTEMFWEKHKVTACQVRKVNNKYFMAYVGFSDKHSAKIGFAKSSDGIHWERHPDNPIITQGDWKNFDRDAAYKPFILNLKGKSILYYNGRRNQVECIGAALSDSDGTW